MHDPSPSSPRLDVLIVGGGLAGLSLAVALGRAGVEVAVVERTALNMTVAPEFDGRVTAISYASWKLLQAIGAWRHMEEHGEPILDIRVTDGAAPVFLDFDHRGLGGEPFGFMVENRHIRLGLLRAIQDLGAVRMICPASVEGIDARQGGVEVRLSGHGSVCASLVVAADGRRSPLREAAGIGTVGHGYAQTGIVTTIAHDMHHQGIAHERFLPAGPFAVLPITGRRSSLVWSEKHAVAAALLRLDDAGFNAEIQRRLGGFLGEVRAEGPRFSYPYAVHVAERFCGERLALVGDAAHGIHPIAGQGLNLGWRDVAALAELVVDAARLGLDVGSPLLLEHYDRWRRVDTLTLASVTDGLNALFTNDIGPVRLLRDAGLAVVDRIGPLKRFFMQHARGTVGTLPRLLKGEAL
ncbi:MAG: FAD-binding protein [Alphaproteobacteria bacterium]|nr:FAD-binding protein [Alphaproteobacteria bacterium]